MNQEGAEFNPPKTIMIILTIFSALVFFVLLLLHYATKDKKYRK